MIMTGEGTPLPVRTTATQMCHLHTLHENVKYA